MEVVKVIHGISGICFHGNAVEQRLAANSRSKLPKSDQDKWKKEHKLLQIHGSEVQNSSRICAIFFLTLSTSDRL